MNNDVEQRNSALYQYAVPAAIFIFAAVSITIYFRSSVRRRPPGDVGTVTVALRGSRTHQQFDPGMKPEMFEVYLAGEDGDGGQQHCQWRWDHESQTGRREWAEIMPLSVTTIDSGSDGGAAAARAAKRASAATSLSPPPPPLPGREVDPRPSDAMENSSASLGLGYPGAGVLVSVIVRMPVAPPPPDPGPDPAAEEENGAAEGEDETPLPYLELGLVEVEVLRAGNGG